MGKIADTTRSWALGQEHRRQMLAFDVEFEETKLEVRRLDAKVLDLEKKVHPLQKEVERLQQRVNEEAAKAERAAKLAEFKSNKGPEPASAPLELEGVKETMLRLLNEHPRASTSSIAEGFKMTNDGAKFHLEAMRKKKLIDIGWDDDEIWWLEQAGREYLYKKGWLK